MKICTIGYTKKSAEEFFNLLVKNGVQLLLDIRLNNKSQLAGFTKKDDLKYFLSLFDIKYEHCSEYAPTPELLSSYQNKEIGWNGYEVAFNAILETRGDYRKFFKKYSEYEIVCLLCSESQPVKCHRRLVAEKLRNFMGPEIEIVHL